MKLLLNHNVQKQTKNHVNVKIKQKQSFNPKWHGQGSFLSLVNLSLPLSENKTYEMMSFKYTQ